MLYGIGVDVTSLHRFADKDPAGHFVRRVYGQEERGALTGLAPHRLSQRLAGSWAAKEAFLKAAGRGLGGFALEDIQVLHKESGQPVLTLSGTAGAWMEENRLTAHLSISHDGDVCTAFVVLEAENEEKKPC